MRRSRWRPLGRELIRRFVRRNASWAFIERRTLLWLAGALGLVLCSAACGYRFQPEAQLPAGAQTLRIELFENRTNIAGLEAIVANGLVFKFTKFSRIALVSDDSSADLVLRGSIRSVELKTVAARNKDAAGERSVTLTLDVRLVQPGGKTVWSANGMADSEVYVVSNDKIFNDEKERATLGILAGRIAEAIFNRFTDEF
jgi:outer membrane lipopolysaccharide assembly protein LptE/RlpB